MNIFKEHVSLIKKYHKQLSTLTCALNSSIINDFLINQRLIVKQHNIFLKHLRIYMDKKNFQKSDAYFIDYYNYHIINCIECSLISYKYLCEVYQNSHIIHVFYNFFGKLNEFAIIHDSVKLLLEKICFG